MLTNQRAARIMSCRSANHSMTGIEPSPFSRQKVKHCDQRKNRKKNNKLSSIFKDALIETEKIKKMLWTVTIQQPKYF